MAATVLSDVNFRVYVGPYHLDYDWSAHSYTAAFAPTGTTVATSQASGGTSLIITSATGYGTSGGVWVGPNGSGQAWEYEKFTARSSTTLTVVRESSDREHNGAHTSGALVYQWHPVTTNDGKLNITEEIDENLNVITWRATISGVLAPQHVLRNGHIVIVTTSVNGGTYQIELVGFVDSPTMTDDARSAAEWTLNIVSSAQIAGEMEAAGVRVGDTDLANAGSASTSTELVLAYDERSSGDFTQASPDFSGASAIDDDDNTLWIAEHFTGTDYWSNALNSDPENGHDFAFAQIYVNPPPSAGPGARFIECRVRTSTNVTGYSLNAANGGSGTEIWIFSGPGEVPDGGSIFFVEDEDAFSRLNPLAQSAAIFENRAFFTNAIRATGGELWLRIGEINSWRSHVVWGDGNGYINHVDAPSSSYGTTVTAPTTGQTMRYIWTHSSGAAYTYWVTDMVRHAGYNIDNDDPIWAMVTLPGFGLTLASGITASVPGNSGQLYLNGPDEKYSTDGLPSSGVLVLGDEQISYSSKTGQYVTLASSGARGYGGTTAAIHNEKDEVYLLDSGTPTDAYLIKSIGWSRSNGTIYPKWFRIYTSNLIDNVRNPDQDDYAYDWVLRNETTNNTASSIAVALSTIRVKHILIEIMSMTTDPARPRLNEIDAIIDSSLHDPDLWLSTGTTAGSLIRQLLINAGIPSGAISHGGTAALTEAVTGNDNTWTVIADIAEYAGCRINVARDSKIAVSADPFWTGTPTVSVYFDRSSVSKAQKNFRKVAPLSQVILPWKTADESASGKIYYPSIPARGVKLERPETIYSDSSAAQAAAQKLYFIRLYPFEAMITAAGDAHATRAGSYANFEWQFSGEMQLLDRNYAIMSADHTLEKGNWTSTFRMIQYGKESNL